jgi:hypothetical protein
MAILLSFSLSAAAADRRPAGPGGSIPAGTQIQVRMIDSLSSATAKEGDVFHGTLERAVVMNGRTLYPKGANVVGKVVRAHSSGRLSDPGELELMLTSATTGSRSYGLAVQPLSLKGESHAKSNVGKIGGGTAAGAITGAIAGGGKGAAIGAGVGAAAGTGVAAATGKKDVKIESEAVLTWVSADTAMAYAPPTPAAHSEENPRAENQRETNPYDQDRGRPDAHARDHDDAYARRSERGDDGDEDRDPMEFSEHDRQYIRDCMAGSASSLPPGLAKKDRLPPGLEKQVHRNGTLPPGLQKRMQRLPGSCTAQLPRLPSSWIRVVLGRRVLLLDGNYRISDVFDLDDDE